MWLNLPFERNAEAKRLGARFDGVEKSWYVPPGHRTEPFRPWIDRPASETRRAIGAGSVIGYWRNAIGVEVLDALANDAEPVGPDRALGDEVVLPDEDDVEEGEHLLLVGRFEGRVDVLLAVPLLVAPDPADRSRLRLTPSRDAQPRLNARRLEQPGAEPEETDIGTLSDAEAWTARTADEAPPDDVAQAIARGLDLLWTVTGADPAGADLAAAPGVMAGRTPLMARLVRAEEPAAPVRAIADLYDAVLRMPEDEPRPGLLGRWIGPAPVARTALDLGRLLDAADDHVAHMDANPGTPGSARPCFPLERSQRIAVLTASRSDLMAVQGPPGTGKTSMMKAVAASAMVSPLLEDASDPAPAFILATAATNKAVTNVIAGFGGVAGPYGAAGVADRWLPGIGSFGWFAPSRRIAGAFTANPATLPPKRRRQAEQDRLDWGGFQLLVRNASAPTAGPAPPNLLGAADGLRLDQVEAMTAAWLDRLRAYAGVAHATLTDAAARLRREASKAVERQRGARAALRRLLPALAFADEAKRRVRTGDEDAGIDLPPARQAERAQRDAIAELHRRLDALDRAVEVLEPPRGPWAGLRRLLRGPRAREKAVAAVREARSATPHVPVGPTEDADSAAALRDAARADVERRHHRLAEAKAAVAALEAAETRWIARNAAKVRLGAAIEAFMDDVARALGGVPPDLAELRGRVAAGDVPDGEAVFHMVEDALDLGPRVEAFHLAARYWEARCLLLLTEREREIGAKTPYRPPADALRRFREELDPVLMLAPCVVATAHSAPRFASMREGQVWGAADLLIVDEAGQAPPEILSACLALTRRALVVGDTLQLDPVWSETPTGDRFLRTACRLKGDVLRLAEGAGSVSSGSAMLMAERAAAHRPVMLSRHYRCLPQIIGWCNEVVYANRMTPHRGADRTGPIQPVGHVTVRGVAEQPPGGSRRNPAEVDAVLAWLRDHRAVIESGYGPLGRAVAVISPYRAHAKLLEERLREAFAGDGDALTGLVVGTVHRLQGAEAPVVLFSVCATRPSSTAFLDEKPNLLNVAVSRAKNSFIVFAHPDMIARSDAKPFGRLASWVARHPFRDPPA